MRDYIAEQLTALGLKPQLQVTTAVGTRYQEAGRVQNILAWLPGTHPNGKAVLLVAHYDGVEAGPAAGDDGAGCAALLETLRALRARKQPLAHDVIVLFTDGEEAGLLGAAAFVREHPWAKDVASSSTSRRAGRAAGRTCSRRVPGTATRRRCSGRRATSPPVRRSLRCIARCQTTPTCPSSRLLGVPALNFAFADGVERYHTATTTSRT